jgi:rubrerythrin
MRAKTVLITKEDFLNACISIEGLCANLYHHYSRIYADIPEAVRLWKKTALEEENHQKQFELALRLLKQTEFEVSMESLKRVHGVRKRLLQLSAHIQKNKPELVTAVSKALEMEEELADLHAQSSLNFKDVSMQNLFKALSEADRDHVADMQQYRNLLHQPLCKLAVP